MIAPAAPTDSTAARVRSKQRADHHRLYLPSRVFAAAVLVALVAFQRWDGEPLPVPTWALAGFFATWPVVMYALRLPFPSNRAADRLQLLDGLAMGALLGATRAQAFLMFFVGYIFSATFVGGSMAGVASMVISCASCALTLMVSGGELRLHRDISHADVAAIVAFVLYAFFLATLGFRSRAKLIETKRELNALSRELESRVEDRTRAVASANAAISRFVPREFLQALGHDDVTTTKLGQATARDVTVLFADIRNFTSLSERMSPEETFRFLNGCLSRLGPHIRAQSGFVDKYIGDAIMALFPNSPADAVRAALAMQREVGMGSSDGPSVTVGIGVHVGRVMMGTIGEEQRFEATVISDTVNVTARLESLTKQIGCTMLVSREVFEHLDPLTRLDARMVGSFAVKGKSKPVTLVEVFAGDAQALRTKKRAHAKPLEAAIAFHAETRVVEALDAIAALGAEDPEDLPLAGWCVRLRREIEATQTAGVGGVIVLDEK